MVEVSIANRRFSFLAGLLVLGQYAIPSSGQMDAEARARGLSNDLLRLHSDFRSGSPRVVAAQRSHAALLIEQRAEAYQTLIRTSPRQALALAFSPKTLAELSAAFPESAAKLESYGTWRGSIEQWV